MTLALLGLDPADLETRGASWTAREIEQQPAVWGKVAALIRQQRGAIDAFLAPLLADPQLRIVLAGAGTSAFIGECLAPAMLRQSRCAVDAVATTDLVSGPDRYFRGPGPLLLVSFGRSGSSPESVATFDLAEQMAQRCHHLVITCNQEGALYRRCQSQDNALAIALPDETHDRAFAMTSSFTSMLLAAATIFGVIADDADNIAGIGAAAASLLRGTAPLTAALAQRDFERVVYLGSNELGGLAREAALKLLELSDGQVMAGFDTPLGFRHGPKTMVNGRTLVLLFLSNDPYTRRYDLDLLRELRRDACAGQVLALSGQPDTDADDLLVVDGMGAASDIALALPFITLAQSYALRQSLQLGLRPDTPSVNGTVNRVVHGVTIHPWQGDSHVSGR